MNVFNKAALSITTGLLMLAAQPAFSETSQIYRWTDDSGQVHFSQQPPEGRASEQVLSRTPRSFGQNIDRETPREEPTTIPAVSVPYPTTTAENTEEISTNSVKLEKDSALCAKAQQSKKLLMSKPIIRREGKLLTIEEKNAEIQYLDEVISIHC